jgi:hypothetical protein
MKKIFGAVMCLVLLTASAMPAWAQTSRRYAGRATTVGEREYRRYARSGRANYDRRYYDNGRYDDGRSIWDEHRDKITVAGGAGAGAVIGGLAGGKKGAILGALIGAGGSALYTYKVRDRRNERRYRR